MKKIPFTLIIPEKVEMVGTIKGTDLSKVADNHSPRFYVDESALRLGTRALIQLTLDYMESGQKNQ